MKLPKQAQPVMRNIAENIRENSLVKTIENNGLYPSWKLVVKHCTADGACTSAELTK